jgi:hypothetical protein
MHNQISTPNQQPILPSVYSIGNLLKWKTSCLFHQNRSIQIKDTAVYVKESQVDSNLILGIWDKTKYAHFNDCTNRR